MNFTEHDIEAIATGRFRIPRELDETRVLPGPSSKNVEEREQDREGDEGCGEKADEVGILDSVEELRTVEENQLQKRVMFRESWLTG